MLKCGRCGETDPERFAPSVRKRGIGNWCRACYHDWYRSRYTPGPKAEVPTPRACQWCGSTYEPKGYKASWFCSSSCKNKAKNERDRLALLEAKSESRRCVWCGVDMPRTMRSDAKFCSSLCNSKAHQSVRRYRRRLGDKAVKPRREPMLSFIDIAERDGWRCGICGGAVNPRRKFPEPLAGSLDHIIPVCLGGEHTPENVQLAHFRCNWSRRADPLTIG